MDGQLLFVFQQQVKSQCEFALTAIQDINASLAASDKARAAMREGAGGAVHEDHAAASSRLWFSLSALLNATANVSKLLWPAAGRKLADKFPDRGEALRESLGVADDSPLQHRDVRNHFEHLDERIECWWLKSENHNIAVRSVAPLGGNVFGNALQEHEIFEQFDVAALTVAFQGDLFELQPIADEIAGLLEAVAATEKDRFTPPAP